jgi:multiple sugar transport system permease protein|tara:strand:+ start:3107 stop:3976 length:870 start_codon:yes stop_codon:yes gene_type:complete
MAALNKALHRVTIGQVATYGIIFIILILVLVPLLWIFLASLKTQNEIYQFKWLPDDAQWGNYLEAWTTLNFGRYFFNTIFISGINVVMGAFVASFTAFALARLNFPGRNILFGLVLSTMMLPFAAYMIPSFFLFRWLGWIDTYTVLTVPFFMAVPGFYIFLMRQYYMSIPREFDEAAKIDGCGPFRIYWYIVLPISKPAITTISIYIFMLNWEDLLRPVLFINSASLRTLSVGLALLNQTLEEAPKHHLMMAITVIFIIIPILVYLVFQRYFHEMGQIGMGSASKKESG